MAKILSGTVIHGAHRGRELGYPTANLDIPSSRLPASGVYAARVLLPTEAQWRPAAANIGSNPTFGREVRRLEVHLLNYSGDLYRRILQVELVRFLRPQVAYAGPAALIAQMAEDCRQVAEVLRDDRNFG